MGLCRTTLNFDLGKEIGSEGLNSKVFEAFDPQLKANLVVKKIEKKSIVEDYESIDESNFYTESRIMYECKHPHVMEIQYASEDEDSIYFSMPLCKNGSLNSLINKRYLSVREIIKYSLEFLLGIHYIHTKSLIHFDIKPTNILIDNNNKAVVTDFGLAKYTDLYGFIRPNKIYTPHQPPEGFKYSDYTSKADIYQAGITMYRMCNGNMEYEEQFNYWLTKGKLQESIEKGKFPNRKHYLPHIPLKLKRIINKAMSVNVDERYDTILDMINEISTIDKNLDWYYNEDTNKHSMEWSIVNSAKTHKNVIEVVDLGNNSSKVIGKKIRLSDNVTNRVTKWNITSIENDRVFKKIEDFIKELK
ncbi:serine/threonine-protein kinase [Clostridium intestinale]|uniref:serine/threonine-protein kinase n=1 Tax=Clostridium intestinale TaxID=36845 RepID=UPI002DD65B65|nr:serine/threonine-protein kinase [Clostridium intestinale]WRY53391.1 serine/threonine-protein kinase [Clostridium intestinale]